MRNSKIIMYCPNALASGSSNGHTEYYLVVGQEVGGGLDGLKLLEDLKHPLLCLCGKRFGPQVIPTEEPVSENPVIILRT